MPKVIFIDATAREVRAVDCDIGLKGLQQMVGGYIEVAYQWTCGDVCYVNEEGLFQRNVGGFWLAPREDSPMLGNGVIVGKEIYKGGEYVRTADTAFTAELMRPMIRFVSMRQIQAWAKGNASEPGIVFSDLDGRNPQVISRLGAMFADIPEGASYVMRELPSPQPGRALFALIDLNGPRSVSSDAEQVIADIKLRAPGKEFDVIYRDTFGRWDQIVHFDDKVGFAPGVPALSPEGMRAMKEFDAEFPHGGKR